MPASYWGIPLVLDTAPIQPAPETMLLGTSEVGYVDLQAALNDVNINAQLQVRRSYDNTFPTSWSNCSGQQDVGKQRASWISFSNPSIPQINSGSYDTILQQFFASIPPTHTAMVTYKHEINNNNKLNGSTQAEFAQAHARIWSIKQNYAQNVNNVKVGIILTAEPYRTDSFQGYYPTNGEFDFAAADAYRFWRPPGSPPDPKTGGLGQSRPMSWLLGDLPAWAASQGKPIAIGEYGAHPFPGDPSNRANWLSETDTYLRNQNCLAAIYFHSFRGESGPWWLDRYHTFATDENDPVRQNGAPDPDSMNVFSSLLINNPANLI